MLKEIPLRDAFYRQNREEMELTLKNTRCHQTSSFSEKPGRSLKEKKDFIPINVARRR